MISRVTEDPRTHNLEITYVDEDGRIQSEEFDLVILSVGLTPHPAARKLAAICGIATDRWGFVENPPFKMVARPAGRDFCLRRLPVAQGHPRNRGPGLGGGGGGRPLLTRSGAPS